MIGDDALEDWATAEKTVCPECGMEVRAKYIGEHRWINHSVSQDNSAEVSS